MALTIQGRVSVKLRTQDGLTIQGRVSKVVIITEVWSPVWTPVLLWIHRFCFFSSEEETKPGKDRCSLIPSNG